MSTKWDALLAEWKAPTIRGRNGVDIPIPYMLFGTTVNNRTSGGQYVADTPHLAEFAISGSNKAAGRVQHYLKRGFTLLNFYIPEQIADLQELRHELIRASGVLDKELAELRAENERLKSGVLDKRVEDKKKAA